MFQFFKIKFYLVLIESESKGCYNIENKKFCLNELIIETLQ